MHIRSRKTGASIVIVGFEKEKKSERDKFLQAIKNIFYAKK